MVLVRMVACFLTECLASWHYQADPEVLNTLQSIEQQMEVPILAFFASHTAVGTCRALQC